MEKKTREAERKTNERAKAEETPDSGERSKIREQHAEQSKAHM